MSWTKNIVTMNPCFFLHGMPCKHNTGIPIRKIRFLEFILITSKLNYNYCLTTFLQFYPQSLDASMVFACMLKRKALLKKESIRPGNVRKILCIQAYFCLFPKKIRVPVVPSVTTKAWWKTQVSFSSKAWWKTQVMRILKTVLDVLPWFCMLNIRYR